MVTFNRTLAKLITVWLKQDTNYPNAEWCSVARQRTNSGFVLVMTLLAMAAIFVVIVAMLSLSLAESASENAAGHMPKARNNAVLALDEAIANLQRMAGPDTRITAPAEAVAGVNGSRYVTGVWRSWEGLNHDKTTGLPTVPDYASKLVDGEIDPASTQAGRFLGWLVSTPEKDNDASTPPSHVEAANTVPLLTDSTLGSDQDGDGNNHEVHLVPTDITDSGGSQLVGSYAWWVQGENSKAFIDEPEGLAGTSIEQAQKLASSGKPSVEEFGFDEPSELSRVVSRRAMDLASNTNAGSISGTCFHDITTQSCGLLTNTANGGWRRDLSLLSEQWGSVASVTTGLPFFTLSPGVETEAGKTFGNNPKDSGLVYPWDITGRSSSSWDALINYVSHYKKMKSVSGTWAGVADDIYFESIRNGADVADNIPLHPVIERISWIFGYHSQPSASDPSVYEARVIVKPYATVWNPYSVPIEFREEFSMRVWARRDSVEVSLADAKLNFEVGGASYASNISQIINEKGGSSSLYVYIDTDNFVNSSAIWKPGETRMYSLDTGGSLNISNGGGPNQRLAPGLGQRAVDDGHSLRIISGGGVASPTFYEVDPTATFRAELKLLASGSQNQTLNFGSSGSSSAYYQINNKLTLSADEMTAAWGENVITSDPNLTVGDVTGAGRPFLVAHCGLRLARTSDGNPSTDYVTYDTIGNFETGPIARTQAGNKARVYAHEWLFLPVNGWSDGNMPDSDDLIFGGASVSADEAGYIGTGLEPTDGLTNLVLYEVPIRPLLSLGELQHFHLGYPNTSPPYIHNAIGNSHASSQILPSAISTTGTSGYDHSYIGNHLLFDDWFISSITPEMESWSNVEARDLKTVYQEFITGEEPLPNRAYQPAGVLAAAEATTQADDFIDNNNAMGWRDVASQIEVEGMFNINSTSVEVWKAMLKNNLDGEVPEITIAPATWGLGSLTGTGQPVSRTTVAGSTSNAAGAPSAVAGHNRLTEAQITALAQEIVEQIKLRGPFLSLSEFVNRQLSNNPDLAKAGVIESALLALSQVSGSTNPYSDIQSVYADANITDAEFPEAAQNSSVVYGFPGWIRQADILRPLAPVLSARDDTFLIRTYGDSKNQAGKIVAKAWCEAVVQRRAEYLDSEADEAADDASSLTNLTFGRRFEIVSFRWLSPEEV